MRASSLDSNINGEAIERVDRNAEEAMAANGPAPLLSFHRFRPDHQVRVRFLQP